MQTTPIKLVTIIAEGVLRDRLLHDIQQLGARGYTLGEVHGHGTRGISEHFWAGPQLRIETLVSEPVANQIFDWLRDHYFADYSVIAYMADVAVARREKYV